jgi:hypothetical protein
LLISDPEHQLPIDCNEQVGEYYNYRITSINPPLGIIFQPIFSENFFGDQILDTRGQIGSEFMGNPNGRTVS